MPQTMPSALPTKRSATRRLLGAAPTSLPERRTMYTAKSETPWRLQMACIWWWVIPTVPQAIPLCEASTMPQTRPRPQMSIPTGQALGRRALWAARAASRRACRRPYLGLLGSMDNLGTGRQGKIGRPSQRRKSIARGAAQRRTRAAPSSFRPSTLLGGCRIHWLRDCRTRMRVPYITLGGRPMQRRTSTRVRGSTHRRRVAPWWIRCRACTRERWSMRGRSRAPWSAPHWTCTGA
mmetsp:Transcript_54978/g.156451  ORF Transcript_54978/g.156451 Transcript_54978/m.156451 type:complete len:236 (+) Transcript_54978:541-1248(+)